MTELKPSDAARPWCELTKGHWTLRNESTKQPEYDLHRSVVTLCVFKIKEDYKSYYWGRISNVQCVVNVLNLDLVKNRKVNRS